ncbi:hypothetical protein C8Q73DRAFT_143741 [Cubamyces lactineus]|nr:hypothetical protein C8Q73DRAFT_143741 [Cubamyces lactineus]
MATSNGSMRLVANPSTGLTWESPTENRASASGSPSSDSSPSSREHSWSGPVVQAYTLLPSTCPSTPVTEVPQHLVLTTIRPPAIQVANPGDSFTVPLRTEDDGFSCLPSPLVAPETYHGPQLLFPGVSPLAASPVLSSLDFGLSGITRRLSPLPVGNFDHHAAGLAHIPVPNGASPVQNQMFGFSAPPSAFTLPAPFVLGPGSLTMHAAYMYTLLHETGNTAPSDAPPFQATSYLTELTRPSDVPPDLWAPGLASSVGPYDSTAQETATTPVSYQMQMSDLVALTRTVRGVTSQTDAAATAAPADREDATSSNDATATASSPANGMCRLHVVA